MFILNKLAKNLQISLVLSILVRPKNSPTLLFILILIVTLSCDPVFESKIVNKTTSDIFIEIKFDKSEIEKVWQDKPYLDYLRRVLNASGILLDFDTVNLVSKLKINPSESFTLEDGVGVRPDFFGVKYIRVFADDSLLLDSKDKMINAFPETDIRKYQLIINDPTSQSNK